VVGPQDVERNQKRRVIPTSVAPVTFFVREDADWLPAGQGLERDDLPGLSRAAKTTLEYFKRAGASFFADLVRGTRLLKSEVEAALWELVAAGLVTADGFDNLRSLIDPRRRAGSGSGRSARPRHSAGRWSLLRSGDAADRQTHLEATCRMLLGRYGVVFRELVQRESILPPWRDLLVTFRRFEDRGEVRGGRFVAGLIGEQFALPAAVESLRAMRHAAPTGQVVTISAADPLNLAGIIVPGDRVPAISGRSVRFRDGVALSDESASRASIHNLKHA
jgi:ATP-dependent Lhr-like helicase